jgi:hypothetical protein
VGWTDRQDQSTDRFEVKERPVKKTVKKMVDYLPWHQAIFAKAMSAGEIPSNYFDTPAKTRTGSTEPNEFNEVQSKILPRTD